jgi:hypothetical protein
LIRFTPRFHVSFVASVLLKNRELALLRFAEQCVVHRFASDSSFTT